MCDRVAVAWPVDPWVTDYMREVLEQKGSTGVARVFEATSRAEAEATLMTAPRNEIEDLRRIHPRDRVDRFKARIFILHDQGDRAVPYCDAMRLKDALPPEVEATYLLVHVFQHVSPSGGITPDTLAEFGRLFSFLASVFEYM